MMEPKTQAQTMLLLKMRTIPKCDGSIIAKKADAQVVGDGAGRP